MAIIANLKDRFEEYGDLTDYTVIDMPVNDIIHVEKRNPTVSDDPAGFDTQVSNLIEIMVLVCGETYAASSLLEAMLREQTLLQCAERDWAETMDPTFTEV